VRQLRGQVEAVLVEGGHRRRHPATVPSVGHQYRRAVRMQDPLRGQQRIVIRDVGLEDVVAADPDPVRAHERRLTRIDETPRQTIVAQRDGSRAPFVLLWKMRNYPSIFPEEWRLGHSSAL